MYPLILNTLTIRIVRNFKIFKRNERLATNSQRARCCRRLVESSDRKLRSRCAPASSSRARCVIALLWNRSQIVSVVWLLKRTRIYERFRQPFKWIQAATMTNDVLIRKHIKSGRTSVPNSVFITLKGCLFSLERFVLFQSLWGLNSNGGLGVF